MKLKPNLQSVIYKNDNYKVFNVKPHDHLVDILILACSEDDSEQLLIPVDKAVLVDNIPYFTAMFREDSNWIEGKVIESHVESNNNSSTDSAINVDQESEKLVSCSEKSNLTSDKINWSQDKIRHY